MGPQGKAWIGVPFSEALDTMFKREKSRGLDEFRMFRLQRSYSIYSGENIITEYSITLF